MQFRQNKVTSVILKTKTTLDLCIVKRLGGNSYCKYTHYPTIVRYK